MFLYVFVCFHVFLYVFVCFCMFCVFLCVGVWVGACVVCGWVCCVGVRAWVRGGWVWVWFSFVTFSLLPYSSISLKVNVLS